MISRALLNAPFFIPKDADLLRNRKVNTKKRQNRHLPELAFLILGTYFTAPFILFHGIPDKFRENRPIPFFLYMHALNRIFSLKISVFILQRVIDIHVFCVIFFGQFFDSRVCFSDLWVGAHKKAGRLSPGTGSDRSDQSSARSECQGNSDR